MVKLEGAGSYWLYMVQNICPGATKIALVGGLEHVFPYVGSLIIPTDELTIFSEGWLNHEPDI